VNASVKRDLAIDHAIAAIIVFFQPDPLENIFSEDVSEARQIRLS
jgi:hypothetical protein